MQSRRALHRTMKLVSFAAALDDMAEKLDAASKESAKLEKLRQDFVANISTSFAHPSLSSAVLWRRFATVWCRNPIWWRIITTKCSRKSVYLERLVSDLLDLARLQNPDFFMEMSEVDLREIAEDAVRSIRRFVEKKHMKVRFSCPDQSFIVFGDYGRLRQMLLILLDNAVKFSPAGGALDIELTEELNQITLSVRDQGPGIVAEDLPYIFDRFYKQRSEANKNGTGLGLAIAKQIADRHNAVLKAINRSDGGCEFILSISRWPHDINYN